MKGEKSMNTVKKILIIIAVLALAGGTLYGLEFFHVVDLSPVFDKIPLAGKNLSPSQREVQDLRKENDTLKKTIQQKDEKIKRQQRQLDRAKKRESDWKKAEKEYQKELIKLNEEMGATAVPGSQQKMQAYKNMARYFAEMNTKEAADLLARLNDEDIIGILSCLDADTAAEILQAMPRDHAARIANQMMDVDLP